MPANPMGACPFGGDLLEDLEMSAPTAPATKPPADAGTAAEPAPVAKPIDGDKKWR